jgi:uncharacterized alkaline shock family protein YloU
VTAPPPAPGLSPEAGDPYEGRRGHTTIAGRAVERIVAQAVDERGARAVKGLGGGPRISVDVNGALVTARVRMAVAYPESVREVTHRVRDRVRSRVQDLTGLTVRQVDIDVAKLERNDAGEPKPRPGGGGRRRERELP